MANWHNGEGMSIPFSCFGIDMDPPGGAGDVSTKNEK